jgi:hypothetical protein
MTEALKSARGHFVQEAVHAGDLAVDVEDRHVEPDHQRLAAASGPEVPAEPGLVMVRVDRTGKPKHQPRELALVVVNRWWELVDANSSIALFTRPLPASLLEPPVNEELAIESFYPADEATAAALRASIVIAGGSG